MLKTRIIPILLTDGKGNVVKPVKFQRPYRIVGNLMQHIRVLEKRNVDELILIDIEATNEGRLIDAEAIKNYTKELYCPVTLGGGIKSLDDINRLLNAGADKVAIKSQIGVIKPASEKFGKQAIVGVMDVDEYSFVWRSEVEAAELELAGVGEILLNKKNYEGEMKGYDIHCVHTISKFVRIPVIANCGCGESLHMAEALKAGAHAVAAGSMFLYTDTTPKDCAKYLRDKGYNVRVE